jgi:hypothetical protein
MTQSRRTFIKSSAAAAAATAAPRSAFSALASDNVANAPLSEFGYAEIELLDGPLLEQFRTNHIFSRRRYGRMVRLGGRQTSQG